MAEQQQFEEVFGPDLEPDYGANAENEDNSGSGEMYPEADGPEDGEDDVDQDVADNKLDAMVLEEQSEEGEPETSDPGAETVEGESEGEPAKPESAVSDDVEIVGIDGVSRKLSEYKRGYEAQRESTRRFQAASEIEKAANQKVSDYEAAIQEMFTTPQALIQRLDEYVPPNVLVEMLSHYARKIEQDPNAWDEKSLQYRQSQWDVDRGKARLEAERQEMERQKQAEQQRIAEEQRKRDMLTIENSLPDALKEAGIPDNIDKQYIYTKMAQVLKYYKDQGHNISPDLVKVAAKKLNEIDAVKSYLASLGPREEKPQGQLKEAVANLKDQQPASNKKKAWSKELFNIFSG